MLKKGFQGIYFSALFGLCLNQVISSGVFNNSIPVPQTIRMNGLDLARNKYLIISQYPGFDYALQSLNFTANAYCQTPPHSVMEKPEVPPSGDKHDYYSLARYFWPNNVSASNPQGIPYIRRDGKVNPEIETIQDYSYLRDLLREVETLGLAYYFLENETFVDVAVNKMWVWFLNPETKMNPNLKYAQVVKGVGDIGRSQGAIDMSVTYQLFDGMAMLSLSPRWNQSFTLQIKQWFTEYFVWLDNGTLPSIERAALNNHGVYYDIQYIATALFIDRPDLAYNQAMVGRRRRIDMQITAQGTQPLEFVRAGSWPYAWFALAGHITTAQLAEKVGVNLWNYTSSDGAGIKVAIDYLVPYAVKFGAGWPYANTDIWSMQNFFDLLVYAYAAYEDATYLEAIVNMSFYQEIWTPIRTRSRLANHFVPPDLQQQSSGFILKSNTMETALSIFFLILLQCFL